MRFKDFAPIWAPSNLVTRTRNVFYGWWLVGVSVFMLTLMAVAVFQGLGTFMVALERQFGWSRTALSGAFSFARAQNAAIGPIEGYLVDRFGNKRMITIGFTIMGLGFVYLSQIQHIWQFYVAFIIITLGSAVGGWLAMVALVNNWFVRHRSIAIAAAMSGIHFGGFLVPVLALGIESQGFKTTTLSMGIFILVVVFPVTRLIKNRPEDIGQRPDGDPEPRSRPSTTPSETEPVVDDEPEFTVKQALRTSTFWVLAIVHLSSSVSIVTLSLHLAPKLTDMGMSLSGAGLVVLTYTAIALPTQFVAGFLADKVPKPPLIVVFLSLQTAAVFVIAVAESIPVVYLFAVLYGIGFGGRVPLLTAIRGDYFGRKAFATIMGISQLPNNIAMVGAPLFAGFMFDLTGSYFIPFTSFAILSSLGTVLMLFVKKPPQRTTSKAIA